tara:strand:+ start:4207 stop:4428 length:222 start_codon:yes stop_codon:yes gene_type:complete
MKDRSVNLNYSKLMKAHVTFLLASAEYMLQMLSASGAVYDSEKYGSIDGIKKWNKHKLAKWLSQFDLKLKEDK